MKIELFNNVASGIQYAVSDTIDPSSARFNFKKFELNKTVKFNAEDRYFALKVPTGEAFSFTAKSRIIFEFVQVQPKHPKYGGDDVYLFQITKLGKLSAELIGGGGDGDIEPPNPNVPLTDGGS